MIVPCLCALVYYIGNERKREWLLMLVLVPFLKGEPTEWEDYVERLENYFVAHDIKSEMKKKSVLLSECGTATYKLIRSLMVPQKPSEVEYKVYLIKQRNILLLLHHVLWNVTNLTLECNNLTSW